MLAIRIHSGIVQRRKCENYWAIAPALANSEATLTAQLQIGLHWILHIRPHFDTDVATNWPGMLFYTPEIARLSTKR